MVMVRARIKVRVGVWNRVSFNTTIVVVLVKSLLCYVCHSEACEASKITSSMNFRAGKG